MSIFFPIFRKLKMGLNETVNNITITCVLKRFRNFAIRRDLYKNI